jgi:hypothetical protein
MAYISGLSSMKKLYWILPAVCSALSVFGQQHPLNDTLIPKQHLDDTITSEPKLQGGALIDTVNIKDKSDYQPGYLRDTSKEKNNAVKPKETDDY